MPEHAVFTMMLAPLLHIDPWYPLFVFVFVFGQDHTPCITTYLNMQCSLTQSKIVIYPHLLTLMSLVYVPWSPKFSHPLGGWVWCICICICICSRSPKFSHPLEGGVDVAVVDKHLARVLLPLLVVCVVVPSNENYLLCILMVESIILLVWFIFFKMFRWIYECVWNFCHSPVVHCLTSPINWTLSGLKIYIFSTFHIYFKFWPNIYQHLESFQFFINILIPGLIVIFTITIRMTWQQTVMARNRYAHHKCHKP